MMDRNERMKKIEAAAAEAATNPLIPASIRVGIAAMAEELRDQRARLEGVERAAGVVQ